MKNIILIACIPVLFMAMGCSRYGYVRLNYPQPPAVYLPDDVHSIVIVNRSLTTKEAEDKRMNEAVLSAEIAGSDRLASEECLKAVYDEFNGYHGTEIVFPKKLRLFGTGTRETPEMLSWDTVRNICEENRADVLLVLENFDSNSDLLLSAAKDQVSNILAGNAPRPSVPHNARVDVYSYWRLYDPAKESVIDQYQHTSFMNFNITGGVLPLDALPRVAYQAGQEYVRRYMPSYYQVKRDLYKRAKGSVKHEFKSGWRKTEVANWTGAIEIWSGILDQSNRKTAGRICLNIAVANEVLGNTEEALKWAQKSYEDYGDKLGRDYAKVLLRRKNIER
ncbi:MAG: hypothetical protein JW801_13170 [Bacteroidales bacterium]|nr:hypothetical protein [Bacteroidales bacterium]